jgi:hypothetical protein
MNAALMVFKSYFMVPERVKEIESRDIILFLQDLFDNITVLSFNAYGFKICMLCRH